MDYQTINTCAAAALIGLIFTRIFRRKRLILIAMFSVYTLVVLWLTVLSRFSTEDYMVSFSIFRALRKTIEIEGGLIAFISAVLKEGLSGALSLVRVKTLFYVDGIILNILLFVPLGYLAPAIWPRLNHWGRMLLLGACCSIAIETAQGIFHLGVAEPDDVLNNVIGITIGYLLFRIAMRSVHERIDDN